MLEVDHRLARAAYTRRCRRPKTPVFLWCPSHCTTYAYVYGRPKEEVILCAPPSQTKANKAKEPALADVSKPKYETPWVSDFRHLGYKKYTI
jgi:hypothetical protein